MWADLIDARHMRLYCNHKLDSQRLLKPRGTTDSSGNSIQLNLRSSMDMCRSGFIVVIVSFCINCGNIACGADGAPSEAKHKFELPFADRGPFVHDGWVGFSPKDDRLAAYYTIKGQAYVVIWDHVALLNPSGC
jgi:hypothetical protein